jgi:putative peptidoglycan lipid II flippase
MFRSIGLTIIATFIGQTLNFISEILIAGNFGTSWMAVAYFLALVVPIMFSDLLATAINAVFIPIYMAYHENGQREEFFNTFTNVTMLIAAITSAAIFISSGWMIDIVGSGFTEEGRRLSTLILRILTPLVLTIPLSVILSNRLNAHARFAMPALGRSFYFGSIILSLFLFKGSLGVYAIPLGYVIGSALFIAALSFFFFRNGLGYSLKTDFAHPSLKEAGILIAPIFIAALTNYINILIERSIAAGFSEGSIAALNYAFKLVNFPVNLLILSAASVAAPAFSRYASEGNIEGLSASLAKGLGMVSFFTIPTIIVFIIFRNPIIMILFERGEFNAVSTAHTCVAIFFYSFGILGLSVVSVLSRAFYALKETVLFCKICVCMTALNIALVLTLSSLFGFIGVPLTFSIASNLHMTVMLVVMERRYGIALTSGFLRSAVLHLLSASPAAMLLIVAVYVFGGYLDLSLKLNLAVMMAFALPAGTVVYCIASSILRVKEACYLINRFSLKWSSL